MDKEYLADLEHLVTARPGSTRDPVRYYTGWLVHDTTQISSCVSDFVQYREQIRVVSQNPRYTSFPF